MLPTATPAGTTLATTAAIPAARDNPLRFYVRMAYACAIIAVAGFTPTYWAPVTAGTFRGPSVLHLHGLLFTAWTVLFVVQARLAAADRYERHRALGLAGIALATAMVFAGILVAVSSMRAGVAQGAGDEARAFSIVPITIIAFFAAIFAAAIANSRRPEIHMRLMLVASVSLLPPAFARVVRLFVVGFDAGTSTGLMGNPPPWP